MTARPRMTMLHRSFRPSRDFLLTMLPLIAMSVYFYGARPLIIVFTACATAVVCDLLNALMRRTKYDPTDLSSIVFSVALALLLPAAISYGYVIFGCTATVMLGKHVFGGYENYPFHPTAFGLSLTAVCWPAAVFGYSRPFEALSLAWNSGAVVGDSSAHALTFGGKPYVSLTDLLAGNFTGTIASAFGVIILATLALLVAHRAMTAHVSLSFLAACALFAFIFPRISIGRIYSVLYELFVSPVVFCAVFLAGEPSTTPKNPLAKIAFGFSLGILTMLFRYYGQYDMGCCFAMLLLGPLSGYLDRRFANLPRRTPRGGDPVKEEPADA